MTMLEQRIQQHFFDSADLKFQAAEPLARPIADAAQALLGAITGGGKVMIFGSGAGRLLAPHLAQLLVGRFERERPPLAAVALRDEGVSPLAQQVRALGQPGDVLLAIDTAGASGGLLQAAAAAHERDMTVLVLTGADAGPWRERLTEADVLIAVPHDRAARVAETQLLVLHGLCDAVDLQLMGEQESA